MPDPRGLSRHSQRAAHAGDQNLGSYLNRVIWTLAALSGLFIGLRLYSKLLRRRHLWWDDYVLIASWVALVVSIALQTVAVTLGLGNLYNDLGVDAANKVALYSISAGFASILATCWSKTSFAISLLRISTGSVRLFIWFIVISVNLVLGSNGTIQWVQCWPVRKLWDWYLDGSCFPPNFVQNYNTFVAAYSGLMDIVLALLPWKIMWAVTINKREKLGAMIAMSGGVIAGMMAFLKIMTLYVIGNNNATTVDLFIFGTAEPATAIMAASIPFLRALIRGDPQPKPPEFIEISDDGRKERQSSALDAKDNDNNGESARDSWLEIARLEQARMRGDSGKPAPKLGRPDG
ncbi:hypothetical protein P885DRAFT_47025 [Corynascus similis CBS 632.67]